MWIVNRSARGLVVNHSAREPMLTFGESNTNEPCVTDTPGVTVLLDDPAGMVATPLVLKLTRPLARRATPVVEAACTPTPLELEP